MDTLRKKLLAAAGGFALIAAASVASAEEKRPSHVLLISIDGMHASDLSNYVSSHPASALAALSAHGVTYPDALSSAPSDSFPGLLALVTGGTPKSTGVFYDSSYDRTLFAPGSNCQGAAGTNTVFDESIDKDSSRTDAGGTLGQPLSQINVNALPRRLDHGSCVPVYPHDFVKVNTIFEVIRQHGGRTAWSDKHPAYDLVNGPSGTGVDDLFTPEINADGITDKVDATEAYDDGKVAALLHQIDGLDHTGQTAAAVPTLFGMNFQAVSVAQKLPQNGYLDAAGTPSAGLADAIAHTDASIGKMVAELSAKGLLDKTLIIVSAKHGQSPIDPATKRIVDKKTIPDLIDAIKSGLPAQVTQDTASLIWLSDQARTADVLQKLGASKDAAVIKEVYGPDTLRAWYADAATDSRVPDIIVQGQTGVVYTKPSATKIAEHGGFNSDDTHVPILVSYSGFTGGANDAAVHTTQIAPTILLALGLDPSALQAVKIEQTAVLPDITVGATN